MPRNIVLRVRRGKLIRVPDEWVGVVTSRQKRSSRREISRIKRVERKRRLLRDSREDFDSQDHDA